MNVYIVTRFEIIGGEEEAHVLPKAYTTLEAAKAAASADNDNCWEHQGLIGDDGEVEFTESSPEFEWLDSESSSTSRYLDEPGEDDDTFTWTIEKLELVE